MSSERVLVIHWAPDPDSHMAACGETEMVSFLDGQNKHHRHVYATLSVECVTCEQCKRAVSLWYLKNVKM